ncbi:MAG: hypothetical protein L0332_04775 [Chloroflexi bacterium]|nr:hypothetical protein [Chloroflexota bacterium]MCI0578486.1 hypothetical protein [Chloroflexota bacterium]MCI0648497.1 hypothetical protein [Chloroflexota bacterium]MCI0726021.1 hypothetical protein [Chloroflexota bacterium]
MLKRKIPAWSPPILMAVLFFAAGFVVSHLENWTSFGRPPQPATEILAYDFGSVTVKTSTGAVYQCNVDRMALRYGCDGWRGVEQPVDSARAPVGLGYPCGDFAIPPGIPRDSVSLCNGAEIRYTVLINGTVWGVYRYFGDMDVGGPIVLVFPWCAAIVGLLLGLIVFGMIMPALRRRFAQ